MFRLSFKTYITALPLSLTRDNHALKLAEARRLIDIPAVCDIPLVSLIPKV